MDSRDRNVVRSKNEAKAIYSSFAKSGKRLSVVNDGEMTGVAEGDIVTIPTDYEVYEMPVNNSIVTAVKLITKEGKDFYPNCLTRGARPVDTAKEYVPASGSAHDAIVQFTFLDAFLQAVAAVGLGIRMTSKEVITAQFRGQDETTDVNVWKTDLMFYDKKKKVWREATNKEISEVTDLQEEYDAKIKEELESEAKNA
jgi:hypothetical protein